MVLKVAALLCAMAVALGEEHHARSEQKVTLRFSPVHHGHHGELGHIGDEKPEHHEEYAWAYPSYEFSYKVEDPHTHDFKGQHESRNGDEVKGEYWLLQPDGRKRIVTYHADKHSGFQAKVHYEGEEHHDHPKVIAHHEPHVHIVEHKVEHHKPAVEHKPADEHKPVVEHKHHEHIEHKPVHEDKHEHEHTREGRSRVHPDFLESQLHEPYYGHRRFRHQKRYEN